jgi:hypothetical protein
MSKWYGTRPRITPPGRQRLHNSHSAHYSAAPYLAMCVQRLRCGFEIQIHSTIFQFLIFPIDISDITH